MNDGQILSELCMFQMGFTKIMHAKLQISNPYFILLVMHQIMLIMRCSIINKKFPAYIDTYFGNNIKRKLCI